MPRLQHGGLSHSEIPASTAICASTGLIAAYHVLLRLQEPRHPPCALHILPVTRPFPFAHPRIILHIRLSGGGGSIYIRLFDFCSTLNFSACISMSMISSVRRPKPSSCDRQANRRLRAYGSSHTRSSTGREGDGPPSHKGDGKTDARPLQKGGVPAAPSGTATLLRLSPNHQFHPRPILAVTDFRRPRLSWLDGRCVQGPGTYSPRHG